ncbi:hypothetical protein D0Z08_31125 [Nocardioides immobilis]|uniref:Methyltransferase domain-containing protein n=2 Tax=Nocardioides immobilis TaxID=2049295 RepID=A0A417XS93_9ACTN|nr:hypothetical protein D0Z08_31125 [Nocardioides immobilis]
MMVAARESAAASAVAFDIGDVRDWSAPGGVDVLVSNATVQWLPDHLELRPRLVEQVRPGGWFAFKVPGNFDEPSHTIRAELAAEPPYAAHAAGAAGAVVVRRRDLPPRPPAPRLQGGRVGDDLLHVLHGEDPVFAWVSCTGARPTLQALPDDLRPTRGGVQAAAARGLPG